MKKFRVWIMVMIFLTTYINFMVRVNIAISIVSMVTYKTNTNETFIPECIRLGIEKAELHVDTNSTTERTVVTPLPDYGPRYDWNEGLQSVILGAAFYVSVFTTLIGGIVAVYLGPKSTIFWSTVLILIFNTLSVYAAGLHVNALIGCRVLIGFGAGFAYPALQILVARWAPPQEIGKFMGCFMGNGLSIVLTFPLVALITEKFGWDWGFYFVSIQTLIYCIVFGIVVSDSPQTSRFISEEEVLFITELQKGTVSTKKVVPPYRRILTSIPFWILVLFQLGDDWSLFALMQSMPKFMAQVIGFDLKSSGALAALPYLVRVFMGLFYGSLEDLLITKNLMTKKFLRKFFVIFSHFLPGICLILISLTRCSAVGAIVLLVVAMVFNAAVTITSLQNVLDLSPNFAGTIFGITCAIGDSTGFAGPAVLAGFIGDSNGLNEWIYYFVICGCILIFSGGIFIIFGSTQLQPWNEIVESN